MTLYRLPALASASLFHSAGMAGLVRTPRPRRWNDRCRRASSGPNRTPVPVLLPAAATALESTP